MSRDIAQMPAPPDTIRKALAEIKRMNRLPESQQERDYYGGILWTWIQDRFLWSLAPAEREKFLHPPNALDVRNPAHAPYALLVHAFEEFVCEEVIEWGDSKFRMIYDVTRLIAKWEWKDPEMLARYTNSVMRHSKILCNRKGGKFPVKDEDVLRAYEQYIPEMETMISRFREMRQAVRKPTSAEFLEFFQRQLRERSDDYPHLVAEPGVEDFIKTRPQEFIEALTYGRSSPSGGIEAQGFVYGMMSTLTGYTRRRLEQKAAAAKTGR